MAAVRHRHPERRSTACAGALYFVVASGFTLIFGLMRVVNMAHGALYLLGGYIALEVQTRWFEVRTPASGSRSAARPTPSTACSRGSSRCSSRRC